MVKNLPAYAGDMRDVGWVPGSGRSPGGGHDNPFQYSCLENPMDRGAWWAVAHRVTNSWKQLKRLRTHRYITYTTNNLKFYTDNSSFLLLTNNNCYSVFSGAVIIVLGGRL